MPVFRVSIQDGQEEREDFVMAVDEADCRSHIEAQGITQYIPVNVGDVVFTQDQIDALRPPAVTQLTKDPDGRWNETGHG